MLSMVINEELFWAKVDKTEGCWNWTASKLPPGYGVFAIQRRPRGAHRVSYELAYGPIPEGLEVDHVCHNKGCVRPDHLRATTVKQNQENRRGAQVNSASGVRGVSWHKATKKWRAVIQHDGAHIHLGYYHDLGEAEKAVTAKRNELFTHNDIDRAA